jgi:hypothetical protein
MLKANALARPMNPDAVAGMLAIMNQTVAAVHDDERTYRVVLNARAATASTVFQMHMVEVTLKPALDYDLTDGQRAAVMAGFALHEVGHIRYGQTADDALLALVGPGKVTNAMRRLLNIAQDVHDESAAKRAFPGLAPAVDVAMWWLMRDVPVKACVLNGDTPERLNEASAAVRYPWTRTFDTPETQEWQEWWARWAERCHDATDSHTIAALTVEGMLKIRDRSGLDEQPVEQPVDEPQPTDETEPPDGPGGDTDGPDEGEDEDGEDEDGNKQGRQTTDEGEEPGEDEDVPGGSEPQPADDDTEPGDDKGGDKGEQGEPGDDATDDGDTDADDAPDAGPESGKGSKAPTNEGNAGDPNEATEGEDDVDPKGCSKPESDEDDGQQQYLADRVEAGRRESASVRTYVHGSSKYGQGNALRPAPGRRVKIISRQGNGWGS